MSNPCVETNETRCHVISESGWLLVITKYACMYQIIDSINSGLVGAVCLSPTLLLRLVPYNVNWYSLVY